MGFKGHLQWLEGCLGEEEIDLPVTIYMNMTRSAIPAHRLGSDPRVMHPTPGSPCHILPCSFHGGRPHPLTDADPLIEWKSQHLYQQPQCCSQGLLREVPSVLPRKESPLTSEGLSHPPSNPQLTVGKRVIRAVSGGDGVIKWMV